MEAQQQKYEDQISKLSKDYEEKIEKLRSSYSNDIEALKNDQRMAVENIRQSKLLEFATIQENGSYLNTLKSASGYLSEANDNLRSMRTNIESNIERLHTEKEIQLAAKEQRLNGKTQL